MTSEWIGPLKLEVQRQKWPLIAPLRISGYTFRVIEVLVVTLEKNGVVGRGECALLDRYPNAWARRSKPARSAMAGAAAAGFPHPARHGGAHISQSNESHFDTGYFDAEHC
jgi:hypothetical protein